MIAASLYLPAWQDVAFVIPRTFVAHASEGHPARALFGLDRVRRAYRVATTAHAAVGQRRADGATPYIVHPLHAAALAYRWGASLAQTPPGLSPLDAVSLIVVALLHDVLEDTKLTADDLAALGVDVRDVSAIKTLTKREPQAYEGTAYFEACAPRYVTWLVKAADRCSNLLSAAADAVPGERNQRWKNYVDRTRTEMLPVYERLWPEDVTIAARDYVLATLHEATRRAEAAAHA